METISCFDITSTSYCTTCITRDVFTSLDWAKCQHWYLWCLWRSDMTLWVWLWEPDDNVDGWLFTGYWISEGGSGWARQLNQGLDGELASMHQEPCKDLSIGSADWTMETNNETADNDQQKQRRLAFLFVIHIIAWKYGIWFPIFMIIGQHSHWSRLIHHHHHDIIYKAACLESDTISFQPMDAI